MATATKGANARQKLAQARLMFLQEGVKKSGKNMHLEFKYFELEDIVPTAIKIFAELGLVTTTEFDGTTATMTVYNTDNTDEPGISFVAPYREAPAIVSSTGKQVTNEIQALGSSITYLRRYLYMMALDIVESDDIDSGKFATEEKPAAAPAKKSATPAERKAAKEKLTKDDTPAREEQIADLKAACKTLVAKDEAQQEFVDEIAVKTKGFTVITESACESLLHYLSEILEQYGDESNEDKPL